jgi:hypothetical protein
LACLQSKGKPSLRRNFHGFPLTPQTIKIVKSAGLLGKNVHDQIGIVAENPFATFVALDAGRPFADLLQLVRDLVGNRLQLARVSAVADQEKVREGRYFSKVQNLDFSGFFRLRRPDGDEPVRLGGGIGISTRYDCSFRFCQNVSPTVIVL